MKLRTIGIDLAKNVFQVCGVNEHMKSQFNQKLKRPQLLDFMRQQAPTMVVMEACYSSHYWGREMAKLGHDVKLIPAQHVTPFVRGNKNDHNDAFAITEASQRPYIRFVPIKTEHQQEISCLHRIRERLNKNKVALSNQSRGLLSEFGVVFPCGHKALLNGLNSVIDNAQYSHRLQDMVIDMLSEYNTTIERLKSIKKQLDKFVDESESGKILLSIPGIGVINASALLAAIDKGHPPASGNISKMGGITKRGDRYLRKQLIHGARALVSRAAKSTDSLSVWATKLRVTKPFNKVAVAVAHRLARLIWILLTRQERYCAVPASLEVSA
jgi:transposase